MNKTKFFNDSGGKASNNMTNGMNKNDMGSGMQNDHGEEDRSADGR